MTHPRQHISDMAELLYQLEAGYVIISPGSRNAPLINAFYRRFGDRCISIVDERSAGYVALGLARSTGQASVLISTSGTAVLNYAPSLAESYYQRIPIIAITADRPSAWVDQQDNQTIRQPEVFAPYVKESYNLPEEIQSHSGIQLVHNISVNAFRRATQGHPGPVHINVPLDEPLYDLLPESAHVDLEPDLQMLEEEASNLPDLISDWEHSQRILIIHGQDVPRDTAYSGLVNILEQQVSVVYAENISNVSHGDIISEGDVFFTANQGKDLPLPDLVIYSGGQVVSKKLKQYLRNLKNIRCWRLGPDEYPIDTFKQNNRTLHADPAFVYDALARTPALHADRKFVRAWKEAREKSRQQRDRNLESIPFSDIRAVQMSLTACPDHTVIDLGNSSSIRYGQLFNTQENFTYYGNRGVSGIDGCLSSAVGSAMGSKRTTLAVLGDLSFGYDSNALWNKNLPANLKIMVLNNEGGGIFDFLDGPSEQAGYEEFFIAHHPLDIEKLAEAYKLRYFCATNEEELKKLLPAFFEATQTAALLEVKTERKSNTQAYRIMMNQPTVD